MIEAFKAKREELGTKALADALGIKDSAVRMVCTGHYPNPTPILNQFARQFINVVPLRRTRHRTGGMYNPIHRPAPLWRRGQTSLVGSLPTL